MRRIALRILIFSVVVSALLGIWALLSGDFDDTQVKVLLTSLCISGASILSMTCAAAWEKSRVPLLPPVGMTLAIGGFGYLIVVIWAELEGKVNAKVVSTLLVFATAAAHASLVGIARLKPRHAWLIPATWVCALLLASLLSGAIWGEWEEENVWRWVGVLSILLCALTILVPVYQRVGRAEEALVSGQVRYCPACGRGLEADFGEVACRACGARFRIERQSAPADQTRGSSSSSSSSSSTAS